METLEKIDRSLFFFLNGFNNKSFDFIMPLISSTTFWIPLYLFFIFLLYKKLEKKIALALFCIVILIFTSDQISTIIKKNIQRYRPSHNIEIQHLVHTVDDYKGGQYGFISSHASNTFAISIFLILLFEEKKRIFKVLLILWAILVSYSRIYLGVHYPSDIIGGALLGGILAFSCFQFYRWLQGIKKPA